jgi:hypothetical protein
MEKTKPTLAKSIRAEVDELVLLTTEGHSIGIAWIDCSSRLADATWEQRQDLELSPGGYGIHWPQLDEDLSVEGLIQDRHKTLGP